VGIRARLIGWTNDPKHPALPGLQAIVADRGYTGLLALATSHGLNLDIKVPPAPPMLPPTKPGGKWRKGKRVFTPLRPLYKVENAFARLGMWRRLSRCYEQTALGAQTWMEVACVAYLCGRLRVEPT
jgi:transposase